MNNNIEFNLCNISLDTNVISIELYSIHRLKVIYSCSQLHKVGSWFQSNRGRVLWL